MNVYSKLFLPQQGRLPATLMMRVWLLTAIGLWVTAGTAWSLTALGVIDREPDVGHFVLGYFLSLAVACWYEKKKFKLTTLSASIIYLFLIVIVSITLNSVISIPTTINLFGVVGAMFACSALLCYILHIHPESGFSLLILFVCGLILSMILNGILATEPIWVMSTFSILLWSFVAFYDIDKIRMFTRQTYESEDLNANRSIVYGAFVIYASALAFFPPLMILLVMFWFKWKY